MIKFSKFFEIAYLAVAVFFLYQGIILWGVEQGQSYLFLFFAVVAVFMFFFRRHFRRKYQNRNK